LVNKIFWKNKRVFVTGHTGFKGSWLCLMLSYLGAKVTGYALKPPTKPNLFELCSIDNLITSVIDDVRNGRELKKSMLKAAPDVVIHMAAQPLVRASYKDPVETYTTNVIGTVNLLEAARSCKSIKAVINVTTDKCYQNREKKTGYKEDEVLGGHDPYSSSKACSEIVTSAYRDSFFGSIGIATARAGNVIGGGDWAKDRLIPDFFRAILFKRKLLIRNPNSIRPWQHVLEPLSGYLILAQKLVENSKKYSEAWNFGPDKKDIKSVKWILDYLYTRLGEGDGFEIDSNDHPHETTCLILDSTKARTRLNWDPKWTLKTALDKIIDWLNCYLQKQDVKAICFNQIEEYLGK